MSLDPYEKLANAIILQAVEDYRNSDYQKSWDSIEQFFRSGWFSTLTNLDGEELIAALRKEKIHGS